MAASSATLPEMLGEAQAATHMLADMANAGGIRLDRETTEALAARPGPAFAPGRYALVQEPPPCRHRP